MARSTAIHEKMDRIYYLWSISFLLKKTCTQLYMRVTQQCICVSHGWLQGFKDVFHQYYNFILKNILEITMDYWQRMKAMLSLQQTTLSPQGVLDTVVIKREIRFLSSQNESPPVIHQKISQQGRPGVSSYQQTECATQILTNTHSVIP